MRRAVELPDLLRIIHSIVPDQQDAAALTVAPAPDASWGILSMWDLFEMNKQHLLHKRRLRRFINHPITEMVIMGLIIISVVLVLYEFSLEHGTKAYRRIENLNDLLTWVFIAELGLRFYVEQRKRRFFRKYWLDIIAVIPFLRSFRILRVFRLLRLFRFGIIFTRRMSRWTGSFQVIKTEYIIIGISLLSVVLMGAFSIRMAEGHTNASFATIEQSLWFALMTVIGGEPIGGDPKTTLGRVITATLMMGGLTVFAILTGTISAVMVNSLRNLKLRTMELDELENHVVICGWNRAGRLIIEELLLERRFRHVVVVTEDESLEQSPFFASIVDEVYLVVGDYTRVSLLQQVGIERASFSMLLADESKESRSSQDRDARTVLAAMLIEKLNKEIYTVVQLLNRDNETSLRQVGVEEIIVSDEYVGNIMATVAKTRGIVKMLDELLTSKYGYKFVKSKVPPELVGLPVGEVIGALKRDYDATLIGVDLGGEGSIEESMKVNPPSDLILEESHRIILAASDNIQSSDD